MDYAAWKLFVDAAELGSLSKVAVAYGTSQPHIRCLPGRFGPFHTSSLNAK